MKKGTLIEDLELSTRVKNSLTRMGRINTLGELINTSDRRLLSIRGIGENSLKEIKDYLNKIEIED